METSHISVNEFALPINWLAIGTHTIVRQRATVEAAHRLARTDYRQPDGCCVVYESRTSPRSHRIDYAVPPFAPAYRRKGQ